MRTLRSLLLTAEYAICFHSVAIIVGHLFLNVILAALRVFLSLTEDAGKSELLCLMCSEPLF